MRLSMASDRAGMVWSIPACFAMPGARAMADPSDPDDFRRRMLDAHFEQYLAFTRLLLSLATGSFSLLAALSGNLLPGTHYPGLAKVVLPLLLVSMLAGVLVQYRVVYRPLRDLAKFARFRQAALDRGHTDQPIILRKLPSTFERMAFHLQIGSFALAFVFLSSFVVLSVNSG